MENEKAEVKEAVSADKLFSTTGKDLRVDAKDTQKRRYIKMPTANPVNQGTRRGRAVSPPRL
jgi:hypothetical protein